MIGGGLRYQWDFGDGSPLTPPSEGIETMMLTHAYQEPGTYDATLHVFDDDNAEGTCTQTISVVGPKGAVGSTISNGFEEVTLIGVRTASLVCDHDPLAPAPGMIYVIVHVRVGAVAGRISYRGFRLLAATGPAKYSSGLGWCLGDNFAAGFISTGKQVSGEVLFEVPPSSSYTLLYDADYSEQPITFGFEI
jgi:PKD repeat protein